MRRFGLALVCVTLALVGTAQATNILWDDGDGNTATINSATWNDLQTAFTSAQNNVVTAGLVKVSGDLQRTAGDATNGDLKVTTGNVAVSGGWDSSFTTQGAKSTLNVNGSNSANNQYRVLTISGAATTVSNFEVRGGYPVGDGSNNAAGGGIYVSANSTTLQNLRVTANTSNGSYNWGRGGGIAISGASGVRVSNCEISNNVGWGSGGGILAEDAGTATNPVIVENSTITGNSCVGVNYTSGSSGGGISFTQNSGNSTKGFMVVANNTITNNRAKDGSGIYTWMWDTSPRLTVYGSLIAGNYSTRKTGDDYGAGSGNGVWGVGDGTAVLVNCTVADNTHPQDATQYGIFASGASWSMAGRMIFINSISANNNTGMYDVRREGGSGGQDYIDFLRSTVSEANYYEADSDGNLNSTSLLAALSTVGNTNPGYWSRNDSGTLSNNIEQNIDGAPGFAGAGNYQLTPGSNSVDNALLKGTTYNYIDINLNNSYDAMVDIIVAGTPPPTGNHLVYLTDLLGNARIQGFGLDRGAFEMAPPPVAEPTALLLGLLGLPLLRRRRA